MVKKLNELINLVNKEKKKTLVVAAAEDKEILKAVAEGIQLNIINAVLTGNEKVIRDILSKENIDLKDAEIIDSKDKEEAINKAVELVSLNKADFLMKGLVNTSDILKAVLNKKYNLKRNKLLSHVMVYDIPLYHKLLLLTDGGMVTYPTINDKVQIINNAVGVAHRLNINCPKTAIICAAETVSSSMESTIDAAQLTQMNKRGQISDCIIDGPIGFDIAISKKAAIHKGLESSVAGEADILVVPNIESGNFLGKALTYFGGAESAGIIVGAKCPIVLVSRADSSKSKLYSILLGSILS